MARDLGRFQQPTSRERAVRGLPTRADLPSRIGPVELEPFGERWVARHRMGPLMRELRRVTDPLFRRVDMSLEEV